MSSRIFKNYQVNVGMPFQIRQPIAFHTLQRAKLVEEDEKEKDGFEDRDKESYEDVVSKAKAEAELVVKEAQLEALRMLETAEREANERKLAIEEEARKKGYEDGYNEARKKYEDMLQEAEFIREHARTEYREVLESIESDAVDLIMEIARKVIGDEIRTNKESVLCLVKQAFERCTNKDGAVLKVSAEDYDYLVENKERLLAMVEGMGDIEIRKDLSLKAGSCIVETSYGSVDAGVHTKLRKIEEAFKSVIAEERGD